MNDLRYTKIEHEFLDEVYGIYHVHVLLPR